MCSADLVEGLGNMDLLSQTQSTVDDLLSIAMSTIKHLSTKAGFKPVDEGIPVTQAADFDRDLAAHQAELAADFVRKAKQLEHLISRLPEHSADDEPAWDRSVQERLDVNQSFSEIIAQADNSHRAWRQGFDNLLDGAA